MTPSWKSIIMSKRIVSRNWSPNNILIFAMNCLPLIMIHRPEIKAF
jgi:hypothetical protein